METQKLTKETILKTMLDEKIKWFTEQAEKHKLLYRVHRYLVFGLTSCSTILAGAALKFKGSEEWLNLTVVITTAIVGTLTSIEGLRKFSELWIHERSILLNLTDMKREIDFIGIEESNVDTFFNRFQSILGESMESWIKKVDPTTKK
jgi:hypothetical protein